jgi:hypothetical protein
MIGTHTLLDSTLFTPFILDLELIFKFILEVSTVLRIIAICIDPPIDFVNYFNILNLSVQRDLKRPFWTHTLHLRPCRIGLCANRSANDYV